MVLHVVVCLKSCEFLKRKLVLIVANSGMIYMLWNFFEFNLPVNLLDISTSCEKLRAFERNLYF